MQVSTRILGLVVFLVLTFSSGYGATIKGTVKGPDGAPFEGAFFQAQSTKTNITVSVLSGEDGRYLVPNLPAGEYRLRIRAVGYKSDSLSGVTLTGDQNASVDVALQKTYVRWSDLSIYQGVTLLPDLKGLKIHLSRIVWAAMASKAGWRRCSGMRTAGATE